MSMSGLITPNLVQIHVLGASGEVGKYNVFCLFYLFISFSQTRLQVKLVDEFLRATAQQT